MFHLYCFVSIRRGRFFVFHLYCFVSIGILAGGLGETDNIEIHFSFGVIYLETRFPLLTLSISLVRILAIETKPNHSL